MGKMRAAICTKYGKPEVFQLKEVEKPVPKDNEVCIKIYATAVTASDIFIRSSNVPLRLKIFMRIMLGIRKPRNPIIGLVFAGVIESTGKDTKRFKPGDNVYGLTGYTLGTYAEYKCMKETDSTKGCIALKPSNISFEEATAIAYGGLLALQHIEKGNIQTGHRALIYGASGTSGTFAVQMAKHLGAEVTAVCGASNLEMVKSLGADHVIDYTTQDSLPEGIKYDFILDSVGIYKSSKLKKACKDTLSPTGKYASIDDGALKLDSRRLDRIREYVEHGYINPVIDRCYPLEDIIEAHRYVEKGHKKGGVAITIT
ncbi:MAG: NAD(P)-dependent alcohol dehydrogenase [Tannerellaceae bacterium]|nr:NAD(P)-dependent alcohol dehydrogenase [Tannerellaceae bacterium]